MALLLASLALAACGPFAAAPAEEELSPQPISEAEALVAELQAAGLSLAPVEDQSAGLFDLAPLRYTVGGGDLHVYEFSDEASAQAAAATIPDLLAVTRWVAPPHFYHQGRLIVLYLGEDAAVTAALEGNLGREIAGTLGVDGDAETVDQVMIYLVALEDNGASGDPIGCGDSIVGVVRPITPTASPIEAALTELLSIKDTFYGESGLMNALAQSDLHVKSAVLENGLATVRLTGQLLLGGVCDNPRVQAQLEYTVLQFPGVEGVQIFINDVLLQDVLSLEG
jgi:hypothetical protein